MSNLRPISEWKIGTHPDTIWVQTKGGKSGVAIHYDCQEMRADGEDIQDAFTWWPIDDGSHIELNEIAGWRLATENEISFSDEFFEEIHSMEAE